MFRLLFFVERFCGMSCLILKVLIFVMIGVMRVVMRVRFSVSILRKFDGCVEVFGIL